ncbi:MAG: CoA transferase [Chloroflexi bacterium]|nr:CoA transferase [Chloroflexota bacterium]
MTTPLPFEGLKVIDFSWIGAGPLTAQWLGNFGATVIKVEHHQRYDILRNSPPIKGGKFNVNGSHYFAACNNNKLGITVDLNTPQGLEVGRRLVKWTDVIVENYIPGTMKKWGLDYEGSRAINPSVIMVSLTLQGQTGPHAQSRGYGPMIMGLAGIAQLGGWPDRPPGCATIPYPDWLAPVYTTFALAAALDYRQRTGQGQYIDAAQLEGTIHYLGASVLDYTVNGRVWNREGNKLMETDVPYAAPHGAYPCIGDDAWCAIAVFNDAEWATLVRLMGDPAWAKDQRFATHQSRCRNTEALDAHIGAWTKGYAPVPLMELLQANGITAGAVHNQQALFEDKQLNALGHYQWLEHPVMGRYHAELPAARLSTTPAQLRRHAPLLGGDNDHVYRSILSYTQEEYDLLLAEGIVGYYEAT